MTDTRLLLEDDLDAATAARVTPDFDVPPIPFGRTLQLGSRGNDVKAVKRAMTHAGYGKLKGITALFGVTLRWRLKAFQKSRGIAASGVYGPVTHRHLEPFFDPYAFLLYTGRAPNPPDVHLQLPTTFVPTHQTAGLPGFPAIDCMAAAGTTVGAPASGHIVRFSGHDPAIGGVPGGAYGWSMYLQRDDGSEDYMTHFGSRAVAVGQRIVRGDLLGTVCDARVAHMSSDLSHIHLGHHAANV